MTGFDRREFLIAGFAGVAASSFPASGAAKPSRGDLPNIIFIMADDLGYADLSCTGSHHINTPHIDSIAKNGLFFTDGYAGSCVCSATRTALLTGCYRERFRVGLEEPIAVSSAPGLGIPRGRRTIASVLKARGYRTALVGKWHLGQGAEHGPTHYGYDQFFGIEGGGADYFRHHLVKGGIDAGAGLIENDHEIERTGYLTDLLGDQAVQLIQANRGGPLFLSLHFTAPHWPWEGREDVTVAQRLKETMDLGGGSLATYARMVEAMDENVGKVLAALEQSGQLANSIVVFTSDNGGERFSETWPFVGAKAELLEGGVRVPILLQWPSRIPPGGSTGQVMTSMDFLPSFLAIAGEQAPAGEFDGMDLSAHWLGKAAAVERTLYWRYKAHDQAAIRAGDWKFLRLEGREHLFNLKTDEHERADLALRYPERLTQLKSRWEAWNAQMLPYPPDSYSHDAREIYSDRY